MVVSGSGESYGSCGAGTLRTGDRLPGPVPHTLAGHSGTQTPHFVAFVCPLDPFDPLETVLWIRIHIHPHWFCSAGSGYRMARMTQKTEKIEVISCSEALDVLL